MSNLPPNSYQGPPGQQEYSTQYDQVPFSQPNYTGMKQDNNSNSPLPAPPFNNTVPNHFNQSANSSPAFNAPGMLLPRTGTFSPIGQTVKPVPTFPPSSQFPPTSQVFTSTNSPNPPSSQPYRQVNDNAPPLIPSSQPYNPNMNGPSSGPIPSAPGQYPPGMLPPGQAHNFGPSSNFKGGPPSVPSSVPSVSPALAPPRPGLNGPNIPTNSTISPIPNPGFGPPKPLLSSSPFNGPNGPQNGTQMSGPPISGQPSSLPGNPLGPSHPPINQPIGPTARQPVGPPGPPTIPHGQLNSQLGSQNHLPPSGPQPGLQGPPRPGPPPSGYPPGPGSIVTNQPKMPPTSLPYPGPTGPPSRPPISAPPTMPGQMAPPSMGPIGNQSQSMPGKMGPPSMGPIGNQSPSMAGQMVPPSMGPIGNQSQNMLGQMGPPSMGPFGNQSPSMAGQMGPPSMGPIGNQSQSMLGQMGPPNMGPNGNQRPSMAGQMGPPSMGPIGNQSPSMPGQMGPPNMPPLGPQGPQSLPPMPPQGPVGNMQNRYPQMPQNYNQQTQNARPYPQYGVQGVTQQMGQMSVTKQGFDQLWGHQVVDLLQCRHILPERPEPPPEIRLVPQFADASNCSPEIFRCTINRIPETNSLLQKSRLPLGILIHPFKDLNHLPVIQCATIVRCRACRTYINPFVYFVDSKRWKCNLCYRVNDLPEEFQYDPVSKSYGDPSRRPEIRSATIEFIAPGEYMLRPPQPAVYLFLLDVSQMARDSGYLEIFCNTLLDKLSQLPGDARTQVGFICYDSHVHYYLMEDGLTRPKEMTVLDIDDVFLPSPESLLVNLGECRSLVSELLTALPRRFSAPGPPGCALGAALQAAYKLMAPTGGRISVFQTCLPNVGPGALTAREDPNARSSKEVAHLNPATDFYKRLALECSGAQVAVDLFLLNSQYSDLATLSGMSKFSGGSIHHIPLFKASRSWQAEQFTRQLTRYLTRKIGFEAVMRVRCTRGITIHTFHGNFFVRSTDLLSLPNVSPDAGFGMQLAIEESLADLQQVCFQAALLYTSSKGERRIRVHTLALPIASNLTDVLHAADQQCIIGLLSKMAVDRCVSASMSEAKEALINVAMDVLAAHRLAANLPAGGGALLAPATLRLLPLYLLATLKRKAFRTGTSTRLDDRVADMCDMKTLPLSLLLLRLHPDLYAVHEPRHDPPRLPLSAERINSNGAYLLDEGDNMIVYICRDVSPAFLHGTFGVTSFNQLPDEARALPEIEDGDDTLHRFIEELNAERSYEANLLILKDNSPSRTLFTERLIEDRVESAFSYYEFLQHIKSQVK